MALDSKRIVHNTLFMYVRMVLTMIVSLFTVRIILKALGVIDYGVYMSIAGVITSLSFISNVLASASQRFFSFEMGKMQGNLNYIFGTTLITYGIVSIIVVLIAETLGLWFVFNKMVIPESSISAAHWVFQFALFSFVITLLANPFQAMIISSEKMQFFAYISILEVVLKLAVAYIIMINGGEKLKVYAILLFGVSVLTHLFYVAYGYRLLYSNTFKIIFSISHFKEIFHYTSWTIFGTIANICNTQGLNILLNIFFGPIANTAYAISSQVSVAVNSLATNFYVAVRPPLIKSYASEDWNSVSKLFYLSTKMLFILLFILGFPVIYKAKFLLDLWLDEISEYMVSFVKLIIIYTIISRLGDPITVIAQAANKVKIYHGIIDSFTILTLPLAYLALKYDAPAESVFIIGILILVIAQGIRLIILNKFFKFSITYYLKEVVLRIIITIVICGVAATIIQDFQKTMTYNFLSIFLLFIVALYVSWITVLNKSERNSVINLLKKK